MSGRLQEVLFERRIVLPASNAYRPMNHPDEEFENTSLWNAIDAAVADLEHNRDVELKTSREYVIGYLCSKLAAQGVPVAPSSIKE